jgi:DNA polymerase-3 subunit gamma/tau
MQISIKLRPRKFSEVFGQDSVIRELETRKIKNLWPSAILLKGTTGIGKTTIAQIIAMTINCQFHLGNGDPCCECSSCQSIINETFNRDTIRLDGGQSGKDAILDFTDTISIAPMYDNNHIIIIEESDQLSKQAKASLLKILEKPHKNVYFILLSMVSTGLPPELQSRCQVYNLKTFSTTDLMFGLKGAMEKMELWNSDTVPKGFKIEGLRAIAETSQGSLRTALQCLEKCLVGEFWTPALIKDNLGIIGFEQTSDVLMRLLNGETSVLIDISTVDFKEFFEYSYTVLSSAFASKINRYKDVPEYYESRTKIIGEHPHLLMLLNIYSNLSSLPFIRKAQAIALFAGYIQEIEALYIGPEKKRIFHE